MRAFGSVFVQEFGTLVTGGVRQQDTYLRNVLPAAWANGANGFLFWCMRDIVNNNTMPYLERGIETMLGLFDTNDSIKEVRRRTWRWGRRRRRKKEEEKKKEGRKEDEREEEEENKKEGRKEEGS